MKTGKGSGHLARNIALALLLAVVCVGSVELAACRHFAPDTYDQLVAPVRQAAAAAADAGKAALDAAGQFCRAVGAKTAELAGAAAHQASVLAERAGEIWEGLMAGPEETPPPATPTPEPNPSPTPSYRLPTGDPPLTQVMEADGKQILTGGCVDIVYYCQSDEEWAQQLFGTDPIGPYGCGPTAMAMVVASMTDAQTDPAAMAAWAADNGYWARRSGSYHSIVPGTAQAFGLEARSLEERTVEQLCQELSRGHVLVALMGPGHFTSGGHFILLRGMTLSGDILVADPNSLDRSLTVWDPQLILDELSSARDSGAPLWVLSIPSS